MEACQSNIRDLLFADPLADSANKDGSDEYAVHIRIQQRNGKKSLTTVQVGGQSCSTVGESFLGRSKQSSPHLSVHVEV